MAGAYTKWPLCPFPPQRYDTVFFIAMSHEHHVHLITSHWTVCSTGADPWHYWLFVRETTKDWWKCLVEDIEPLQLCPGNVWVVQKWHISFFYMRLHVQINGTKHSPINPSMSQVANVNIYGWHMSPCPIFVIDCRGWEPPSASALQVAQYVMWQSTYRSWDKMAAISQTTFSNSFSSMKIVLFLFKLHWYMFASVQLTILSQHWLR